MMGHSMEYVVEAETRDSKIGVLKRGFASKEGAQDRPIRISVGSRYG